VHSKVRELRHRETRSLGDRRASRSGTSSEDLPTFASATNRSGTTPVRRPALGSNQASAIGQGLTWSGRMWLSIRTPTPCHRLAMSPIGWARKRRQGLRPARNLALNARLKAAPPFRRIPSGARDRIGPDNADRSGPSGEPAPAFRRRPTLPPVVIKQRPPVEPLSRLHGHLLP
jgi:hypothetical protein